MNYYSTNRNSEQASLKDAVVRGLAPDRGLYMPEQIPTIPAPFFKHIGDMSLQDIAFVVADQIFGEDIDSSELKTIVSDTLNFEIPLVKVEDNRYALELFHGPTLAFKDVGARFMARILGHYNKLDNGGGETVNVLVATSGDTGSAVANGFLNVTGIKVYVLYPKGKVSAIQEAQFTTLGANITAIEVDGTFDDCQALVKSAFMDAELNKAMKLTSANSINVARFLPQMFYYFHAYAQLVKSGEKTGNVVVAVPSGNFGNICAGLIAKRMGLPISRFIAANNKNDVFYNYLLTGTYSPKPSVQTIANAMDVGDPSNFARVIELYGNSHEAICKDISGCTYNDDQIRDVLKRTYQRTGYLLDPHGAVAYRALEEHLKPGETGIFLETAHPAKFKDTVEGIIGEEVAIPAKLQAFMRGEKQSIKMNAKFPAFKKFLLNTI
jgi:threonine synthase